MQGLNNESDATTKNKNMYIGIVWLLSGGGNLQPLAVFVIGAAIL